MMSKQQRLYYEQNNKERVKKELEEYAKTCREHQENSIGSPFNPHEYTYFT